MVVMIIGFDFTPDVLVGASRILIQDKQLTAVLFKTKEKVAMVPKEIPVVLMSLSYDELTP